MRGVAVEAGAGHAGGAASPSEYPCVSVELKPKSCIRPRCAAWQADPVDVRHRVCRYCLHQVLKAREAVSSENNTAEPERRDPAADLTALAQRISGFCPVHLYSGDEARIHRAVMALVTSPQNNFRVFVEGACVYTHEHLSAWASERIGTTEGLACAEDTLITHAPWLQSVEIGERLGTAGTFRTVSRFTSLLAAVLSRDRALECVAKAQAKDTDGVEAVHAIIARALGRPANDDFDESDVHEAIRRLQRDPREAQAVRLLRDFMIAATAKDCSILVTMRVEAGMGDSASDVLPPPETSLGDEHLERRISTLPVTLDGKPAVLHYSIAVVDLDPKPVARIAHYLELEQQLVRTFVEDGLGDAVFAIAGRTCGFSEP